MKGISNHTPTLTPNKLLADLLHCERSNPKYIHKQANCNEKASLTKGKHLTAQQITKYYLY